MPLKSLSLSLLVSLFLTFNATGAQGSSAKNSCQEKIYLNSKSAGHPKVFDQQQYQKQIKAWDDFFSTAKMKPNGQEILEYVTTNQAWRPEALLALVDSMQGHRSARVGHTLKLLSDGAYGIKLPVKFRMRKKARGIWAKLRGKDMELPSPKKSARKSITIDWPQAAPQSVLELSDRISALLYILCFLPQNKLALERPFLPSPRKWWNRPRRVEEMATALETIYYSSVFIQESIFGPKHQRQDLEKRERLNSTAGPKLWKYFARPVIFSRYNFDRHHYPTQANYQWFKLKLSPLWDSPNEDHQRELLFDESSFSQIQQQYRSQVIQNHLGYHAHVARAHRPLRLVHWLAISTALYFYIPTTDLWKEHTQIQPDPMNELADDSIEARAAKALEQAKLGQEQRARLEQLLEELSANQNSILLQPIYAQIEQILDSIED